MIYVLDASAMLAYLWDEPGADVVEDCLTEPGSQCVAHAVNLCEVYYRTRRKGRKSAADTAVITLTRSGVVPRDDIDPLFWKSAGDLKSQGGISLADCFAVALAVRVSGTLLTTDHGELERIARDGPCLVRFIR